MFETDEEQEMLYTMAVNLEYFSSEMQRGYEVASYGKRADNYRMVAKLLKMACSLIKELEV